MTRESPTPPVIRIDPEPSAEEAAAILAAVQVLRTRAQSTPTSADPPVSKWRAAARHEALRGLDNDPATIA